MTSQSFKDHSSRFETKTRFFMGVSVGQGRTSTGIAVARRAKTYEYYGNPRDPKRRIKSKTFEVGFLERMFGASYPKIVTRVGELLRRETWGPDTIEATVDISDVGTGVVDLFDQAKIDATYVSITSGEIESKANDVYRIGKLPLISGLQALLHDRRLRIQQDLAEAQILIRELQSFQISHTDGGRAQFRARDAASDDLVLALAVAIWSATTRDYESSTEPLRI